MIQGAGGDSTASMWQLSCGNILWGMTLRVDSSVAELCAAALLRPAPGTCWRRIALSVPALPPRCVHLVSCMLGDRGIAVLHRAYVVCVNENSAGILISTNIPVHSHVRADETVR